MARSSFRLKKHPISDDQQGQVIREELVGAMRAVGAQHEAQRNAIVNGWAHRPKFRSIVNAGPKRIFLRVILENGAQSLGKYGGTIRDLWRWHNDGTRAHEIRPRLARALRFVVGSITVFARLVRHPGTKARHSTLKINRRLAKYEDNQIRRGFKNAFQRLKRENQRGRNS